MAQIDVTDAAPVLLIKGAEMSGETAMMRTVGDDVYLGDKNVTAVSGLLMTPADGIVSFFLDDGDVIYGIAATAGTPVVHVLAN